MADIRKRHKSKDSDSTTSKSEETVILNARVPTRKSSVTSLRILSRVSVIVSLLIIVYFSTNNNNIKPFAKQTEVIPGKGLVVECSPEYFNEVRKYEGCYPFECKRFVTDKVVTPTEVEELLGIAKKGLSLGGSAGGASILDLHSGALSLGQNFVNIYKIDKTKEVFTESDFVIYRVVKDKIKYAVAHHFGLNPTKIYLTHPTFFSQITSKKAVTVHDEYWHPHVDKETYKSFHYTTLLYLSDYGVDFEGGRFIFVDDKFNRTVEPRKARVSMFTSGKENLHYVEKVKSGTRYAMTISFTCDKTYAIEDPSLTTEPNMDRSTAGHGCSDSRKNFTLLDTTSAAPGYPDNNSPFQREHTANDKSTDGFTIITDNRSQSSPCNLNCGKCTSEDSSPTEHQNTSYIVAPNTQNDSLGNQESECSPGETKNNIVFRFTW